MQQAKLISFHGKPEIKEKYLKRLRIHHDADEIIKGKYWEGGKGCAVGCTIHSGKHDSYDTELGITWRLALLEDSLFESLPNEQAKKFPLEFLNAMPVGVDTNIIFKSFVIWNLVDEREGLIYHIEDKKQIELLTEVSDTYKRSFTEEIPQSAWKKLADKAASASAYAYASASAYAYAYASAYAFASASASAFASAYASAYAFASAFASASASAYAFASALPEWQNLYNERIIKMKNKLLELMINQGTETSTERRKEVKSELQRVDITKNIAVLPIDETSDLKNIPEIILK